MSILYYLLYFAGLPFIIVFFYFKLRSEREFINFFSNLNTRETEENVKSKKGASKRYRRSKIIFIIVLIAFLGSWHFITSEVADFRIRRELKFGASGAYRESPVVLSLGPTYDVDGAVETIKEKRERWLPEKINEVVNLDKLSKRIGRIAIYRTYDQRYIITFTYPLPYPVIKSFGFQYVKTNEGQLKIIKKDSKTIYYPLDPGSVDTTGKLIS
ncbi:MAG: hypothetical protein ABEJ25_06105 [Candidatus Bipolaricaulia bacterium]